MKLLQKLRLSAIVTCYLTGQGYSMGVGPADAAAAVPGPDFFARLPEQKNIHPILFQHLSSSPDEKEFAKKYFTLMGYMSHI